MIIYYIENLKTINIYIYIELSRDEKIKSRILGISRMKTPFSKIGI